MSLWHPMRLRWTVKLSELEIDTSKDWRGYVIKNLGAPKDPYDSVRKIELDTLTIPWGRVTNKPSTFPPSPHTHARSDITDFWNSPFWDNIPDKPSTFPPSSHTHYRSEITDFWSTPFWGNIPDKPSTFPPSAHTHTRSDITDFWSSPFWNNIPDKPSTFPPSPHTHYRSDIVDFAHTHYRSDIVDFAHTHTRSEITDFWSTPFWNNIPDKPSTFPPSPHTHYRSDITDFWNSPFWNNIPDKPSTFPPEPHTHTRSEITDFWSSPFWNNIPDKPSTFPPSAHKSTHESGGSDAITGWISPSFIGPRSDTPSYLWFRTRNISDTASVDHKFCPTTPGYGYLGDPTYYWWNAYIAGVYTSTLYPMGGDNTGDIGTSTRRWAYIYAVNIYTSYLNGWNPNAHKSRHESGGADAITGWISPSFIGPRSDTASYLWFRTRNIGDTASIDHKFCPTTAAYGYLGDPSYYWWNAYIAGVYTSSLYPKDGDNTGSIGTSTRRWAYLYAVNKSAAFRHPAHNPERYIVFKCVEGPKVTVEDWGIAELKDGVAFVTLSEEFVALMSDKAEYAVFLTPEGPCNGLYVSKKLPHGFEVRELNNGRSNIRFSWLVKAIRIGDEETPVLEEPPPTFKTKEEELEWERKRAEEDRMKEEERLRRMKDKIEKYRRETTKVQAFIPEGDHNTGEAR